MSIKDTKNCSLPMHDWLFYHEVFLVCPNKMYPKLKII